MQAPDYPIMPWTPPPPPKRSQKPLWIALASSGGVVLLIVGIVVGSSSRSRNKASSEPGVLPTTSYSTPVDSSTPDLTETTPTESPSPTTENIRVGQAANLTQDGEPWATIVVSQVSQHRSYTSSDGFMTDTPRTPGNVYIQARVTYTALKNGVDYNPLDFDVFVNGTAVDNMTFVTSGPEPSLSSGTLSTGRRATGWVVYEVPPRGKVVMSYAANMFSDAPPIFEVTIRTR